MLGYSNGKKEGDRGMPRLLASTPAEGKTWTGGQSRAPGALPTAWTRCASYLLYNVTSTLKAPGDTLPNPASAFAFPCTTATLIFDTIAPTATCIT